MISLIDKSRFPTSYKRLQKNPIQEKRRPTNVYCLCIVLPIIVISWISCGIYDISTFPQLSSRFLQQYARIGSTIFNLIKSNIGSVAGCMALTLVLIYLFIVLLRGITKFFAILAWALVLIICCFMFSIVLILFIPSFKVSPILIVFFVILLSLPIGYEIALLMSIRNTGLDILSEIIKETCRVFFHYPLVLIFSLLLYAMHILVGGFFIVTAASIPLRNYPAYIILHWINILGTIFLGHLITSFGQMIISQYYAYWYWKEGKTGMSNSLVLQNTIKMVRNHIGTAVYGATVIMPVCLATVLMCRWKQNSDKKSENGFIRFVSKIRLIFEITDFAMIQTSVHGYAFKESAEKSVHLILHNCSKYLSVLDIFGVSIYIGKLIIYFIITAILSSVLEDQTYNYPQYIQVIVCLTLSVTYFIDCSLSVAVKTILLCIFEDLQVNDGSEEKPYHMNNKLQILLTEA